MKYAITAITLFAITLCGCAPTYRSKAIEKVFAFDYLQREVSHGGGLTDYKQQFYFGKYSCDEAAFMRLARELQLEIDKGDVCVEPKINWIDSKQWDPPPCGEQWESGRLYSVRLDRDIKENSFIACYFKDGAAYIGARSNKDLADQVRSRRNKATGK